MRVKPPWEAITIRYGVLCADLSSDAWVCEGYDAARGPASSPPIIHAIAVWDTGTSNSVISEAIAAGIGAAPAGSTAAFHLGGSSDHDVYVVNITLPNGISIPGLEVLCGPTPGCDVLIGMDIIGLGDFAVSNFQGETVMSFRTPSVAVTDYEV
jgi:hypothetical protein